MRIYNHGDYIAISGEWTVPIKKEKLKAMKDKGITLDPNSGFARHELGISLSVLSDDEVKIVLSQEEFNSLINLV